MILHDPFQHDARAYQGAGLTQGASIVVLPLSPQARASEKISDKPRSLCLHLSIYAYSHDIWWVARSSQPLEVNIYRRTDPVMSRQPCGLLLPLSDVTRRQSSPALSLVLSFVRAARVEGACGGGDGERERELGGGSKVQISPPAPTLTLRLCTHTILRIPTERGSASKEENLSISET